MTVNEASRTGQAGADRAPEIIESGGTARLHLMLATAEWSEGFGDDPFPYGLEANRKTPDAFCRFAPEQGVTARRLSPDDQFPKEVRASVRV